MRALGPGHDRTFDSDDELAADRFRLRMSLGSRFGADDDLRNTVAVTQIDKITQANAASAEENASVTAEMKREVAVLRGSVNALRALLGGQRLPEASKPGASDGDDSDMRDDKPENTDRPQAVADIRR